MKGRGQSSLLKWPHNSLNGFPRSFSAFYKGPANDLELNIMLSNCKADEDANIELDMLVDYCEGRLSETTPERLLQALAEAITGLHESETLWDNTETIH